MHFEIEKRLSKLYSWSRAANAYELAEQRATDARATLHTISLEQYVDS